MDLAVTADGHVVISHDPALNPAITRGPDGRWIRAPVPVINRLTLAELAAFDVGRMDPTSRYAGRFPDQEAVDGARIPTLVEALALGPRAGARPCISTSRPSSVH